MTKHHALMPSSQVTHQKDARQGQLKTPGALRLWIPIVILLILFATYHPTFHPVYAQEINTIIVQPPDIIGFPTITVDFKLSGINKHPNEEMSTECLKVYENNSPVRITNLTQRYRGVFFSLAINASRELDLNDATGASRFDKLSNKLHPWAANRTFAGEDTWSLVTNTGVEVRHVKSADEWTRTLMAYQPNFRLLEPEISSLETAIHIAAERVVSLGTDKMILYITPPPEPEHIETIKGLMDEAVRANIKVNVWMVGDPLYLINDQGGALMALAANTGGTFFHYTGEENIPDPENYFSSIGFIHTLTYESKIHETGTYPLRIEATVSNTQFSGESQPFFIDIQPPNPIFISPTYEFTCQNRSKMTGSASVFTPECAEWQITVEFPDNHPREIIASHLFVDGDIVDINDEPPFDVLTWRIPAHVEPGEHTIQAEVVDSLGLSARTILTPFNINLNQPELSSGIPVEQVAIILIWVLLGGAFLFLLIWLGYRFFQRKPIEWLKRFYFQEKSEVSTGPGNSMIGAETILATLIPVHALAEEHSLQITQSKTFIGSDPAHAQTLIISEEIEGIHARLEVKKGDFWLQDLGTSAGSWVNYECIGTENVQIHPGDLIHFGSTGFRFTIKENQTKNNAIVKKYEPFL